MSETTKFELYKALKDIKQCLVSGDFNEALDIISVYEGEDQLTDYFFFKDEDTPQQWWICSKEYYNKYDCIYDQHLGLDIPNFVECMESCFETDLSEDKARAQLLAMGMTENTFD